MKTIRFHCPACNQSIEAPGNMGGQTLDCPNCHAPFTAPALAPKRKTSWRVLVVAGIVLYIGYRNYRGFQSLDRSMDALDSSHSAEEAAPRLARLRAAAPDVLRAACLQAVTGFARVIEPGLSDFDDNANNWTAAPVCEFVNTVGGVERTNLPFVFAVHSGELYCHPDIVKISARDRAAFDAKIKRLRGE